MVLFLKYLVSGTHCNCCGTICLGTGCDKINWRAWLQSGEETMRFIFRCTSILLSGLVGAPAALAHSLPPNPNNKAPWPPLVRPQTRASHQAWHVPCPRHHLPHGATWCHVGHQTKPPCPPNPNPGLAATPQLPSRLCQHRPLLPPYLFFWNARCQKASLGSTRLPMVLSNR